MRPPEASLATLPVEDLGRVVAYLEHERLEEDGDWRTPYNLRSWDGLVSQLRSWHAQKLAFAERSNRIEAEVFAQSAQANVPGASEGERRALAFVIGCFCADQNLAAIEGEPIELARLLAGVSGPQDAGEFGPFDLLRSMHLLHCVVGGSAADVASPHAIDRCTEALRSHDTQAESLGRWLRGRLTRGEWAAASRWLDALLDVAGHADRWRTALDDGLVELRARGLGDEECSAALKYLTWIVPFALWPWPADPPVRNHRDGVLPMGSAVDVDRVFDAMHLFHHGYREKADHEAFRRRLDQHLELVDRAGLKPALSIALATVDHLSAFDTLVNATDDVLAATLEQLRPSAPREAKVHC